MWDFISKLADHTTARISMYVLLFCILLDTSWPAELRLRNKIKETICSPWNNRIMTRYGVNFIYNIRCVPTPPQLGISSSFPHHRLSSNRIRLRPHTPIPYSNPPRLRIPSYFHTIVSPPGLENGLTLHPPLNPTPARYSLLFPHHRSSTRIWLRPECQIGVSNLFETGNFLNHLNYLVSYRILQHYLKGFQDFD